MRAFHIHEKKFRCVIDLADIFDDLSAGKNQTSNQPHPRVHSNLKATGRPPCRPFSCICTILPSMLSHIIVHIVWYEGRPVAGAHKNALQMPILFCDDALNTCVRGL